jgi:uncharacterized protein GlcG (DUF336 family)
MNITAHQAKTLVEAAERKATEIGVPVCIVVLDAGGHLKHFSRMDNVFLIAIDVATRKARTAVLFEDNSERLWDVSKPGGPAEGVQFSNGGLETFAGGIPLKVDGRMLGAIGVSGGTVSQDFEVATAACDVFARR